MQNAGEKSIRPDKDFPITLSALPPENSSAPTIKPQEAGTLRWILRAPWDYLAMACGLAYWGIFGGLLTLIGGPLSLILPRRIGEPLGRTLLHQLFRKFVIYLKISDLVHADLTAMDRLGKIKTPFIAAPNHTSLWDVVFIIARLPQAICVMKRVILINPVLGGGARLAGYVANDSMGRLIRNTSEALGRGGQLLLFPEGTRTRPAARWVNPLKGGCAIIAIRAQVPVYPIFIRSNTRFLQKGWPLWRRPVFPIRLRVDVGEPLMPQPGETSQQFTGRLAAVYEQELSRPDPLRRQIAGEA